MAWKRLEPMKKHGSRWSRGSENGLGVADCDMFCYFFAPGDHAGFAQSGKIHQQD